MARKKGKLKNSSGIVDSRDQVPQFSVPGAEIIEVQEEKWSSIILGWTRNILGFLLLLAVFVGIIVSAMATTILVFSPVDYSGDRQVVVRGTWSDNGGEPPLNSEMVISTSTAAPTTDWWSWIPIGWVGISDPAVVKVHSTSHDKLYVSGTLDNATVVNLSDEDVRGTLVSNGVLDLTEKGETFEFNHQLKDSYLVECVSGDCETGSYYVVSAKQIYGEAK